MREDRNTNRDFPQMLAAALPGILKAAGECGVLGSLENNDDRVDDIPVPRPPLVLSSDGQWVYFLKRRREEDTLLDALSRRAAARQSQIRRS